MSKKAIQEKTLTNIANAIRSKKKTTDPILLSDFATEISNLPDQTEVTPDLTGFDVKKAVIQSAFTGFATNEEKNLWYLLFNAQKDMARTIEHLSVDFELDCGNYSDLYTSDIQNMVQAVDAGITCIIKNLVCNQIEPVVYASVVESSIAGNLKILSGSMYGGEVTLTKSIAKWCSSLILDSIAFNASVTFNLTNCGFDSFQILNPSGSEITLTGVNTIKKYVVNASDVVYNFPQLFMPTNSTGLEEVDIDFSSIKIGNLKQTFKNATYITGFPQAFSNLLFNNCSFYEAFMTSSFLETLTAEGTFTDFTRAFYGCTKLTSVSITGSFSGDNENTLDNSFYGCTALTDISFNLDFSDNYYASCSNMFTNCSNLKNVNIHFKTGHTDFSNYLYNSTKLEKVILSIKGPDGNNVKLQKMDFILASYTKLKTLDFSSFDFSQLTTDPNNWGFCPASFMDPYYQYSCNVVFSGKNSECTIIWPDEIRFEALTSTTSLGFKNCVEGNGANFVKHFKYTNQTFFVYLTSSEYNLLTEDEISAFKSAGGVLTNVGDV